MSLRTETDKAIKNLREIRKAVLGRGGEISPTAGLKDLPDAIYNIPADTSLAFQEDSTSAYRKIVPSKAEEYALVSKVGGMSYKCNNLFDVNGEILKIESGVYVSDNKIIDDSNTGYASEYIHYSKVYPSGTYTITFKVNDTTDADFDGKYNTRRFLSSIQLTIVNGTYLGYNDFYGLHLYQLNDWDEYVTLTATEPFTIGFSLNAQEGRAKEYYDIMLNQGTTALPYEPYFEGLRDTKVTSLESRGANLIPLPYSDKSMSINNIDFTVNDDGTIIANGTASAFTAFTLASVNTEWTMGERRGKSFTMSNSGTPFTGTSGTYLDVSFRKFDGTYSVGTQLNDINTRTFTVAEDAELDGWYCYIGIAKGVTVNNAIYKPMLNYGTEAAPYKPYQADALGTIVVPQTILNREDWGIGSTDEHFNHIDLVRKKYIPKSRKIVYDGSADERWSIAQYTNLAVYVPLDTLYEALPLATGFKSYKSISDQADGTIGVAIEGYDVGISGLFFGVKGIASTTDEWRAYLAEHPITVVMSYKNPTEEDISHLLTGSKFLKTEGGGTIIAHNEREKAVPTTIKYTIKVG